MQTQQVVQAKSKRGTTSYLSGIAAEEQVAATYGRAGYPILASRWRGSRGEIDLVVKDGDGVIFVEVKKAKSHAQAAARVTPSQLNRIYGAGTEFLATQPKGQLTNARVDVALVDARGQIEVIENASLLA